MRGDYKPVPDETVEILERLVDAAEDVIAWYDVRDSGECEDELRVAIDLLSDAVSKASTCLERTP